MRHILHVAAVQGEPGAGFRQVRDIGSYVTNALVRTEQLATMDPQVRTILFPLLGTGMANGPVPATSWAMVLAMLDYIATHPLTALQAICLLASTETEYQGVARVLGSLPLIPEGKTGDVGPG